MSFISRHRYTLYSLSIGYFSFCLNFHLTEIKRMVMWSELIPTFHLRHTSSRYFRWPYCVVYSVSVGRPFVLYVPKKKVTSEKQWAQLFIKHHSYNSLFRLDTFSHLQTISFHPAYQTVIHTHSDKYRMTRKNGNFLKTQQKLKKSKEKNYWQKLNHYNLPFKRQ